MRNSKGSVFIAAMAGLLAGAGIGPITTGESHIQPPKRHHPGRHSHGARSAGKQDYASPIHAKRRMKGVPGSKLARKASEGRLGVRSPTVAIR